MDSITFIGDAVEGLFTTYILLQKKQKAISNDFPFQCFLHFLQDAKSAENSSIFSPLCQRRHFVGEGLVSM